MGDLSSHRALLPGKIRGRHLHFSTRYLHLSTRINQDQGNTAHTSSTGKFKERRADSRAFELEQAGARTKSCSKILRSFSQKNVKRSPKFSIDYLDQITVSESKGSLRGHNDCYCSQLRRFPESLICQGLHHKNVCEAYQVHQV